MVSQGSDGMLRGISLALALAGCSQPAARQVVLKPGMTEQQVVEASGNQVPDRVVQRICGNETAAPFPCRIYVYEAAWREGHYHPKVSAVFEEVRGRWLLGQWL
jgi:hypothetical protein